MATLVYLAGQNAVTPHVWTARADRLERPDRVIFDLDPSGGSFGEVRAAARAAGDLLRGLGLVPFTMTTGSRGLHVVAPLRRTAGYDEGPTRKLGPSSLEHREDGSVTIEGEPVDDPEQYKGERLPDAPSGDD